MTSFKINTNKLFIINGIAKVRSTADPTATTTTTTAAPTTTTTTTAAPTTTTTTTTTPPPATFSYVYKILDLTYIDSINNDIYDLEYDLL
jgi:hypothetical protein